MAGGFALRRMAGSAAVVGRAFDSSSDEHEAEEADLRRQPIVAFRLDGPVFFGAALSFLLEPSEVGAVRVVMLRMSRLAALDATGASVLADTIQRPEGRGHQRDALRRRAEHSKVLTSYGAYGQLAHERHIFDTSPDAIVHAPSAQHASHTPRLTTKG